MLSVGKVISQRMKDEFDVDISPIWCAWLHALSRDMRRALLKQIDIIAAALIVAKEVELAKTKKYDVLANKMKGVLIATNELMAPVDKLMAAFPLDVAVAETLEGYDVGNIQSEIFGTIFDNVSLKLPTGIWTTLVNTAGLEGLEFFEGVSTYGDLRDKVEELEFRAARALTMSNYATTGASYIQNSIEELEAISYVLNFIGT